MRIGIPGLIPTVSTLFGLASASFFIVKGGISLATLFICLLMVLSSTLLPRFKLIFCNSTSITLIKPFRFFYKKLDYKSINHIGWGIQSLKRLGEYRKLIIKTNDNSKIELSSIELANLSTIERHLLASVDNLCSINLHQQHTFKIKEAEENLWYNYLTAGSLTLFIPILFYLSNASASASPIDIQGTIILVLLVSLLLRSILKIRIYSKWLKDKRSVKPERNK